MPSDECAKSANLPQHTYKHNPNNNSANTLSPVHIHYWLLRQINTSPFPRLALYLRQQATCKHAQSFKANIWAFLLTGLIALIAIGSFIWKPKRY